MGFFNYMGFLIHGIFNTWIFCFFDRFSSKTVFLASWSITASSGAKNQYLQTNFQPKRAHHVNFMTKIVQKVDFVDDFWTVVFF